MDIVNPATQWYTWFLALPGIIFWLVWVLLLMRYVMDRPSSLRWIRLGMFGFFTAFIASAATLSVLQYQAFKSGPLGLLPQNEFVAHFVGYVDIHYWRAGLVGMGVSVLVGLIFWFIKKRTGGLLINQEEVELLVLFGFFSSWPHLIVFFVLTFLLFILSSLAMTILFSVVPRLGFAEGEVPRGSAQDEPPRLTVTPFLFIAAFITPIIASPILRDVLDLSFIYITTT